MKNSKGFSIVEIMIVLIVVGLVTTGVLLAAQTLQRNARNDARDRDVQLIGTALSDYASANSGHLTGGNTAIASGTTFLDDLNLTHYDSNNTNTQFATFSGAGSDNQSYFVVRAAAATDVIEITDELPDPDNIHIWVGYQCPGTVTGINGTIEDVDDPDPTAPTPVAADLGDGNLDSGEIWQLVAGSSGPNYGAPSYSDVSKRSFAIVYQHEGGGAATYRCVDFGS